MSHRKIRIRLFAVLVVAAMLLAACSRGSSKAADAPASAAAGPKAPTYVIKMGQCYALNDNIQLAALMLSDLVFERTNGDVKIEVFGGGQLGGTVEQMEMVQNGILPACAEAINAMDGFVPLAGIESYPFLFESPQQLFRFLNSDLAQELWKDIGQDYFVLTGAQFRGVRMLQTTRPVRQLSDLKGLKLRTANMKILHRPWEFLGAATTPMTFTEIYMGLQQGTIEGQENPLFTSYASGFHEIEKYVINTEHVFGFVAFVWNKAFFESLPKNYQDIIRKASDEVAEWRNGIEADAQKEYIKLFLDAGLELIELKDLDKWRAALVEPLKQEFPYMQDWVNRIKEFNKSNP